jgi:putative ABC transport system ATP-binding protein
VTVIELKNITKVFGKGENRTTALAGIDITVKPGEFVAIMGPSGSGKSTLLNIIGLLDTPTGGEYTLDGKTVKTQRESGLARVRRDKIGFIFQSFNLLPRYTTLQNVALPMIYSGVSPRQRKRRARELLKQVGLADKVKSRPNQLSGGQVQRVAIARALANQPSLILADEPTGNLDTKSSHEIISLLKKLNKAGATIVMVTHNPDLARQADRTIHIVDGQVAAPTRKRL